MGSGLPFAPGPAHPLATGKSRESTMKSQMILSVAIAVATLTCAGEAVARSRNVIPLGWVPKSLLRCEITSDHMCAINSPKGDFLPVPLVSLPNGKTTVGHIQPELGQVKQLDERDGWIFIGFMGNEGADCHAQSDDENVVSLSCRGANPNPLLAATLPSALAKRR
jgi:hypothetical protein